MRDREGELIVARADLSNCLGLNVELREKIEQLKNRGDGALDFGKKLEDCYYTCDRKFTKSSGCADQCDRYRSDCLEECRMRYN